MVVTGDDVFRKKDVRSQIWNWGGDLVHKVLAACSEDLSSGPQLSNKKPGMAVHTCDLRDGAEEGKT